MKERKLSDRDLERHEAKRDIWQEVLDGIDEIKAGAGKRKATVFLSPFPIFPGACLPPPIFNEPILLFQWTQ